ncbi:MAG: molybdopterin molybdotransferase MoeA [Firmicutes bacterium]|nr:molybdopterin molybdotransferase MoeA [Bacillota bacterium]
MLEMIELEQARRLIVERGRLTGIETVDLMAAHGRVLAENIAAPVDQPSFNRSPLDGYALKAADTQGASPAAPAVLKVIDTIYAGGYSQEKVVGGTAVRLMTGSPIPEGADCVIRQEDTRAGEGRVEILKEHSPGDNYCFKGEYFTKGDAVLAQGDFLGAAQIGVLAGLGIAAVPVYQRPVAAIISTGDELIEPGTAPAPGRVYSSNYYTIACRLRECGVTVLPTGILPDEREAIAGAIAAAAEKADFIVTTGGVSVGEKDLLKEVLENLGAEMVFWKVNIKPGSPALFSVLEGIPVISLSGNPLAASVTFELLLCPLIKKITGSSAPGRTTLQAVLQSDFNKKSPVRRALRGRLTQDDSGRALVTIIDPEQSPGNLQVVLESNCYIDIATGCSGLKRGELVPVII